MKEVFQFSVIIIPPQNIDLGLKKNTFFFQALSIPTKISKVSIKISKIFKPGHKIDASEATLMDIFPFSYGLLVGHVYEILSIKTEYLMETFLGYTCKFAFTSA